MLLKRTRAARQERLYQAGIHTFQTAPFIAALRDEAEYRREGRDGVTLVKTPELRAVLEVLMEGIRLAEHQEPGPILLEVLEGELRFEAGEEILYLREGEVLSMPLNRPHSVEAVRDSAFLLVLAPARKEANAETTASADLDCDPGAVRRLARELRQVWPTARERFGDEWPQEGGDDQC